MYYEIYERKIMKLARIRDAIYKWRFFIIAIVLAFVGLVLSLLGFQGHITKDIQLNQTYVYGERYAPHAEAFLNKVEYEYLVNKEWSSSKPIMPGNYSVRAISKNGFNKITRGKPKKYTILQKSIKVNVASSVEYGKLPEVYAEGLVYGDSINYENAVVFKDITTANASVTLKKKDFCILNEGGVDVTRAYEMGQEFFSEYPITIIKRTITLETESAQKIYDGTFLTADGYTISQGELVKGDIISVNNTGSQEYAGESENETVYQIRNAEGEDVSNLYDVQLRKGALCVLPRPVTIVTCSASKIYDGTALSASYKLDGTMLAEGDEIAVVTQKTIVNVGSTTNSMEFAFIDEETQEDVTRSYELTVINGTLTVEQRPITIQIYDSKKTYDGEGYAYNAEAFSVISETGVVEGERLDCQLAVKEDDVLVSGKDVGVYAIILQNKAVYSSEGENITSNYLITCEEGTLTVEKRKIVVNLNMERLGKIYDARPYVHDDSIPVCTLDSTYQLADNETFSPVIRIEGEVANPINAGEYNMICTPRILNSLQEDVSDNYQIDGNYENGIIIEIKKRPIKIVLKDKKRPYTAQPLIGNEWELDLDEYYELVEGQTLTVETNGSIIEPGEVQNRVIGVAIRDNQNDVTMNYAIDTQDGLLTVTKRFISVKPLSYTKTYDGMQLVHPNLDIKQLLSAEWLSSSDDKYGKAILEGHVLDGTLQYDNLVNVGEGKAEIKDFFVFDQNKENITEKYYDIDFQINIVRIVPRVIHIVSRDVSRVYDGMPLEGKAEDCYIALGSLANGDSIEYVVSASLEMIGETLNAITSVSIFTKDGEKVGYLELDYSTGEGSIVKGNEAEYNYIIYVENGTLTMLQNDDSGTLLDSTS